MKKGFTLIELLVVVLIIGILSAVALPQYRMAVAKSRIAGLIPFGRSLQEAQKLYYMANGSFAEDFTLLDVTCDISPQNPTLCNLSKQTVSIKDNYIVATDHRVSNLMLIFFFDGRAKCMVYQGAGENFANRLCKSISGTDQFILNEVGGSKYYKLWD